MDRRRAQHSRPLYRIDPKPVQHKRERDKGNVHLVNADSLVAMVQEMCSDMSQHSQRLNKLELKINDSLTDMETDVLSNTNTKIEMLSNKIFHCEQQLRQTNTTCLMNTKQLQSKIDHLSYEFMAPNKLADSYSGVEQQDDSVTKKQLDRLFGFCKLIQRDILDIANEQSRISDVNTQLESDLQSVKIHLDYLCTSPTGVGLTSNSLRDLEVRLAKLESHSSNHQRSRMKLSLKKNNQTSSQQQAPSEPTLSSVLDLLDEEDSITNTPQELLSTPPKQIRAELQSSVNNILPQQVQPQQVPQQVQQGGLRTEVVPAPSQVRIQKGGNNDSQKLNIITNLKSNKKTDGSASTLSTAVPDVSAADVLLEKPPSDGSSSVEARLRKQEIERLLEQAKAEHQTKTETLSAEGLDVWKKYYFVLLSSSLLKSSYQSNHSKQVLDSLGLVGLPEDDDDDPFTSDASLPGIEEISHTRTPNQDLSVAKTGDSSSPQFVNLDGSDSDPLTDDDD